MVNKLLLVLCFAAIGGCCPPEKGDRGEAGAQGIAGIDGAAGINGQDGADGATGANGSSVTVVKLCPGEVSYPSVFIEYAFCIDGDLYATYSTHGGFTTKIVPGTYSSNTLGSQCNFVVGPNCEVSQP